MEIITPDIREIFSIIDEFLYSTSQNLLKKIEINRDLIFDVINSYSFRNPLNLFNRKSQDLDNVITEQKRKIDLIISDLKNKLILVTKIIDHNNVDSILKKGFVLVKQNSKFVTRASVFDKKTGAILKFTDGEIQLKP